MNEIKGESSSVRQNILTRKVENNRASNVRYLYGLEPGLFSLYFAFNLTNAILQNQLLKQTCLQLGYNLTICSNLNTDELTKAVEEEVQPYVANINSSILLLNSISPALFSLLLGSWMDKFGRKKILMMSFTGYTSTLTLIAIFSFISDHVTPLSPWCYFFAEFPMCFLGGWPTLDIAVCCYVTDLSDEKNRSFRLGFITFLNFLSNVSAYSSSSFILEATNATFVFAISFSCAVIAFIYTIIFVDESIQVPQNVKAIEQIKEVFSYARIQEIYFTITKKRTNKERRMMWSLMVIVVLVVFTMHGNGTVNYLFVREKFGWALREWTVFDSTNTVITVIGLLIGLTVLKKYFQISDMSLGVLALISSIIDAIFKAFATKSYQLYLSSVFGLFRLLSTPVFRSIMSNILPHAEIGKIFSVTTSFEALSGLGAGPLYSSIYKKTLTTFPGAFHLITASVFAFNLLLSFFVYRWKKSRDISMLQL
ncbi:CLUMA_CG004509, isoform A [Clunio marinus]|uniref:CLUMA_CG004509, isoform A n=1 Tax=Clunio marinus TaxID=568069 RepID=A0A1J1HS61_9DIPT|nr:CLUMA_CG004509, isoform A [Clunio marinus]